MKQTSGFTLIEVLLSVAIIGLITGMSLPVLASFNDRNDLDLTAQSIASQLRRAQTYTRGINGDSQWGVRAQNGSATLFKGSSYAARDTSYDEPTTISSSIAVTGLSDLLFAKLDGTPSATGTITLTNTNTNETRTITINAKGMVSY